MILYEVNLEVDLEVASDFERWMEDHVYQILEIPGFISATWYSHPEVKEAEEIPKNKKLWTIHYTLKDKKAYDHYIENHANHFRTDAKEKFPDRFTATRRVLKLLREF